jgi:hypothetical protein
LSSNVRPTNPLPYARGERFVVSVDRQAKSSFADRADAQKEADRIAAGFPNVVVDVSDRTSPVLRESEGHAASEEKSPDSAEA